ncbi:MAG: DegV family protein [Candidatus Dormibacteria bacterium]
MSRIHLVCDSTADLDASYAAAHEVTVVPLRVFFGEEEFRDQVEMSTAEFYQRMRAGGPHPRTSQPPPGDFAEVFSRLGRQGGTIICTTISGDLSGTVGSALQARSALPDLDIRVVDTRSVAPGHANAVEAAVATRDRGGEAEDVIAVLDRLVATQQVVFTVETLEYLHRGGRIGGAQALLGTVLDIKPILAIRGGKIEVIERVRTYPRALKRLVQEMASKIPEWGPTKAAVAHAASPAHADGVAAQIAAVTGELPTIVEVGAVIGCHAGPGAFGLAFHPKSVLEG